METYGYPYPYPQQEEYPEHLAHGHPDHGDGIEYYGMTPVNDKRGKRSSRSKSRRTKQESKRSISRTRSISESRSRTRSVSRSSHSATRSVRSQSATGSKRESLKEPGLLDAFRVLYLKPSKHKKNTTKYLATKKKQDRIQEVLKSDGLGSKKWLFYPRHQTMSTTKTDNNCDRRVKIDGDFFRKYKKNKRVDNDAPIAKLQRWELILYKKLGFIQAV